MSEDRPPELKTLTDRVRELSLAMEKMKLAEYVELLNKPGRLFFINFFAGLARGIGMAVGFTLLGALLIYMLRRLEYLNIPVIGQFVAEIVRIVQEQLKVK